jgi:NAD+ synthase (glutamine-hydrolysing)
MRIAMAQINTVVGDLVGNSEKIGQVIDNAKAEKADLILFPELAITGYPPQDLLFNKDFVRQNKEQLTKLIGRFRGISGVVGFVDYADEKLYNAAAVVSNGKLVGVAYKTLLPTYDVFDEARYFEPQRPRQIVPVTVGIGEENVKLGVSICEDLWDTRYSIKVVDLLVRNGADIIVNINASPFFAGKRFEREQVLLQKAKQNGVPIFYVNLVGGQDELVFDGQSLAVDGHGNVIGLGKQFEEDLVIVDFDSRKETAQKTKMPPYDKEEEIFNALVLGIRDYFAKTGFKRAVVGMSGGIDSSLTACIVTAALGSQNVIGVSMPSKFSSLGSKDDARQLAGNLGICFVQLSVQEIVNLYQKTLDKPLDDIRKHFGLQKNKDDAVADENIQPRVRGNCLMDLSNRLRELKLLLVNTGNKTELALGYCTLYGDMAGGIGILGDVNKLEVYRLARFVNKKAQTEIIPEAVFIKKASPELKENQFDPFDFEVVSPVVDEIVGNHRSKAELINMGYQKEAVDDAFKRIRLAEYKRWQAVPCIKISPKSFGIGRKMPIVNKYEG